MFNLGRKSTYLKGCVVVFIVLSLFHHQTSSAFNRPIYEYGQTLDQQETIDWLWQQAQKLSGIESIYDSHSPTHLPIYIVSNHFMSSEICPTDPENCRNLMGAYDTQAKRILLLSSLVPIEEEISASFLVHEFMHALQNEKRTDDEMFGDCSRLKHSEQEAYHVQNAFLKSQGVLFTAGSGLRMMFCPTEK
ncbi:hypothetical protein [Psychrobium sp. 1_MG-2023]|uniref:hypothetical protein n=1 Tax=Psychrobium sp. 1_MG-2023 TaxID=3062624 RepID=UPI000C33B775|nr:hypothetical protein [Psychrobium sp. 1_MG-2023]MDP2561907.1 hypothetical protein [Psychrobium sp. 1_MG-2023]PKF59677.1 hypothetical protein CW748_00295 [Alteromonadales bacterium alter-6D02]